MENPSNLYQSQFNKAKEVLLILENQRSEIESKLKTNPSSDSLNKELRNINLDIKITLNEIEFVEYRIQECDSN